MATPTSYRAELTPDQKNALLAIVRRLHVAASLKQRAQIVLWSEGGVTNKEIARRLRTSPGAVRRWLKRWLEDGLDGLPDRPRSGRPPTFPPSGGDACSAAGVRAAR